VTTTISKSLGISVKEAEILKRSTGAVTSGEKDIKEVVNLSLAYIFSEANQVILNYQKKYNKTLAKIILVGGGSSLRGIQALAQANFQIEVVAGDPFKKVEAPAFLEDVLKETGPEFAVAVGLALRRLQEMD
jgi:Tfp pilus assembly PilM family ATPase